MSSVRRKSAFSPPTNKVDEKSESAYQNGAVSKGTGRARDSPKSDRAARSHKSESGVDAQTKLEAGSKVPLNLGGASTVSRQAEGGGKGKGQTEDLLRRRMERLKLKAKASSNSGDRVDNNAIPDNMPSPVHTSTPTFARRMSENDPRRHLIKTGVYSKRKASAPVNAGYSPRTTHPISPLVASSIKPTSTLKRQGSDLSSRMSKSTTPRSASNESDEPPKGKSKAGSSRNNGSTPPLKGKSPKASPTSDKSNNRTSIPQTNRGEPKERNGAQRSTKDQILSVSSIRSSNHDDHSTSQQDLEEEVLPWDGKEKQNAGKRKENSSVDSTTNNYIENIEKSKQGNGDNGTKMDKTKRRHSKKIDPYRDNVESIEVDNSDSRKRKASLPSNKKTVLSDGEEIIHHALEESQTESKEEFHEAHIEVEEVETAVVAVADEESGSGTGIAQRVQDKEDIDPEPGGSKVKKKDEEEQAQQKETAVGMTEEEDDNEETWTRRRDTKQNVDEKSKNAKSSPWHNDKSPTDKFQKLRKRDAELAVMARRLEEKAKEMQRRPSTQWKRANAENGALVSDSPRLETVTSPTNREVSSPPAVGNLGPDIEHMKRVFARQRARDLADSAQKLLSKDKELESLKRDLLKTQKEALEGDLRRSIPSNNTGSLKFKVLEESNKVLQDSIQKLREESKAANQKLEVEVNQQRKTCEALEREIAEERRKSNQLSSDLQHAVNQNSHLTRQLGELHGKLSILDQVLEECRQLREDFASQRQILQATAAERDWLRETVIKLNNDLGLMQANQEKRLQLEREHEEALRALQDRQEEIRRLQEEQDESKKHHRESVSRLEHKVHDLEQKWLEQCHNFGRLSQELSSLRQETSSQLKTLAAGGAGSGSSKFSQPHGAGCGAPSVKGTEAEKEDWKRIAEEALVARANTTQETAAPPKILQDVADVSQGSERSSQRSGGQQGASSNEGGKADSVSDPEDLLDELSDKIDQALLSRLHHASISSGPISKLAVFIARYNYDPKVDSPNENFDSELPLTAGDYIYVYGDPDEDGFYEGELMDGQRGLVPSNFIERIAEENLPGFMQNNGSQCDEDLLSDLDFNSEEVDIRRSNINHFSGDLAYARAQSDHPSDLEDIPEVDEDDDNHGHQNARMPDDTSLASLSDFGSDISFSVPCPKKLTLDRQLKHSIIVSWVPPDTIAPQEIEEFRVYVDGHYRTATKQNAKTRALVENIEPSKTYRISVRTVTGKGTSEDAACTFMIGRDASVAPTNLKASNVGPSSANISWLPGNSNLPHVISVNDQEMQTVKPSIHKYTLTGLSPLSVYRVNIRAKSRKQTNLENSPASKNFTEIEFKTLPGGLPDAPLDIQVRQSKNSSMINVEWLPVTITTSGLSNGAVVMGYAVYANGNKVAETTSPTADRVSVSKSKLQILSANEVIVRTLSPNGSSNDSLPAKLSPELLEEKRKDKTSGKVSETNKAKPVMYANADDDDSSSTRSHSRSEEDSLQKFSKKVASSPRMDVTPKEDGGPPKPVVKVEKPVIRDSEYLSDSDRSELSDIQEEAEEDEVSEFANASLPGLSDSSDGVKRKFRSPVDDEKKRVMETLQYNTKPALEFDTDPELESLNKPDKVVPIPIIRSQRDYERETEQSPHNPVVEPVPLKPPRQVPQIEITKDTINEQAAATAANKTPYSPERTTDRVQTSPTSVASNSLPKATARSEVKGHTKPSPRDGTQPQWNMSAASSNSSGRNHSKDYDAKSNNNRHHSADSRTHSDSRRHSDSLQSSGSSSAQKLSHSTRTDETFGEEEEGFSGSEPEELFDDGTIRFFIAMFDYNPAIMSPNIDGAEEELHFKEGDIIKVLGDKDSDGFYVGEHNGRRGYVPCNMVEEMDSPEQTPVVSPAKRISSVEANGPDRHQFNDSLNTTGSSQVHIHDSPSFEPVVIPKDAVPHRMRALFDYDPRELSPNPDLDVELSFHQGEIIIVYGEMDEDGFFVGELRGEKGLVPSNFLEEVSELDSSTTSRSYSPSVTRNKENRHYQNAKEKYAPSSQQENGEAQFHGSEVTPVISDNTEQVSVTSTPEHTKKKKGILSKGKALFKKLGSSDNKQKHK